VQGLSVEETASVQEMNEQTVKTRLHRARALLQRAILDRTDPALMDALPFPATRCDRVVAAVLQRIGVDH
jgi:RNA polymerase sigma-70 factor (ECF subfamily)